MNIEIDVDIIRKYNDDVRLKTSFTVNIYEYSNIREFTEYVMESKQKKVQFEFFNADWTKEEFLEMYRVSVSF